MYERTFGTDWDDLDREAVLHRAFAIGVAEFLGEAVPDGELDRLRSQVSGRYDRSMVDLAYDEGRTRARKSRSDGGPDDVWSTLVESEGEGTTAPAPSASDVRPARQTDLPEAISTPTLPSPERDELRRFRLPEFLR